MTLRSFLPRLAAATAAALLLASGAAAQSPLPTLDKSVSVGKGLYEVIADEPNGTVYVASTGAEQVKVFALDGRTLAVKHSIDVAAAPAYGLGINTRTQTLYSTNTRVGNVSAIDLRTGKIVATISDPLDPKAHLFRVLVDEESNTIYTSVTGGRIWIIDGATNAMKGIIENVGKTTVGLALDKAGNKLYAANLGDNEVAVIDLATRRVTNRLATGGERSTMLALDTAGNRLFVGNQGTGDLSVIGLADGKVIKTVKTGAGALGVLYNPATNRIYTANRGAGTVTVLDATTLAVLTSIDVKGYPNTLALDRRTNAVYLTSKSKRSDVAGEEPAGDTVSRITP